MAHQAIAGEVGDSGKSHPECSTPHTLVQSAVCILIRQSDRQMHSLRSKPRYSHQGRLVPEQTCPPGHTAEVQALSPQGPSEPQPLQT